LHSTFTALYRNSACSSAATPFKHPDEFCASAKYSAAHLSSEEWAFQTKFTLTSQIYNQITW
jgi:hypothetical protein